LNDKFGNTPQVSSFLQLGSSSTLGRAGMITAGVLVELGVPLEDAWMKTSTARGRVVPDTEEQRFWVADAFNT